MKSVFRLVRVGENGRGSCHGNDAIRRLASSSMRELVDLTHGNHRRLQSMPRSQGMAPEGVKSLQS